MVIKVVLEVKGDVVDEKSGAVGHPGAGGGHPALLPAEHLDQVVLFIAMGQWVGLAGLWARRPSLRG